ncbi:S8 family serine peptidase [Amycolatopsis rhizosphaerae]|uniref:S8 family serine peptidase n=1 Tax=Amycolatopsis rhizosphaerae TaxID=2053003 RepID=UPI001FE76F44|nr:S8 family serine peptidase [Amycolatopsis rhizosphaerae]
MYPKRLVAALLTVTTFSTVVAFETPTASAQQCGGPGGVVVPVPWSQRLLAAEQVWPLSTGAGQRVAVVSTGITDNPLLAGHIAERADVFPGGRQTGGGSGDCLGVGTGVSGIIAAQRTETVGFHGMAPDVQILAANVAGDAYPSGRNPKDTVAPETLAAGINWAVDHRASVIAVPTITYQDADVLRQAVRRALDHDIVVVAAVGETSTNETPGLVPYPAGYDGVLGVGAIGENGLLAQNSRPSRVDLVAPGANVVTTYPVNGLGSASGTAFATAYVAGTVALTRAYRPQLSAVDIARRLLATATPAPEGTGSTGYGHGIVSPVHAVSDEVVAGNPEQLPPAAPIVVSPEVRAREAAEQHGQDWAFGLAAAGLAMVALLAAIVLFGPRGRRRRWRTGLAPVPQDRPEDERPEPPVELFADLPKRKI